MAQNSKPIDKLRREKLALKEECSQREAQLAEHWRYISNNMGSIILSSAVNSIKYKLGIGHKPTKEIGYRDEEQQSNGAGGLAQGILGGLLAASPMLIDVLQPMLMGFVTRKIKSFFTGEGKKKKKKKKNKEME